MIVREELTSAQRPHDWRMRGDLDSFPNATISKDLIITLTVLQTLFSDRDFEMNQMDIDFGTARKLLQKIPIITRHHGSIIGS